MQGLYRALLTNGGGNDLSQEFLSKCFDYGAEHNMNRITTHLLPIYSPDKKQMELFKLDPPETLVRRMRLQPPETIPKTRFQRFAGGKIFEDTLKQFQDKYVGKDSNPPGIKKLIDKLSSLCFIE